jgi:ubiquinol-cytochrome c reductase cytochrome b subunit
MIHLIALHEVGSDNPVGIDYSSDASSFHYYYLIKDVLGVIIFVVILCILVCYFPNIMGDEDNFIKANQLVTPAHIKPEWYFLYVYAILRSIPNKLGGVLALLLSILILGLFPLIHNNRYNGIRFLPSSRMFLGIFLGDFILLI